MIIAIDFDWTIVVGTKYPDTNYKFMPGAEEAIRELAKEHELILNTARSGWYRISAIRFIKNKKLPIRTPLFNRKQKADTYIDDCNLECDCIDWKEIVRKIQEMSKEAN